MQACAPQWAAVLASPEGEAKRHWRWFMGYRLFDGPSREDAPQRYVSRFSHFR